MTLDMNAEMNETQEIDYYFLESVSVFMSTMKIKNVSEFCTWFGSLSSEVLFVGANQHCDITFK